MRQMTDGSTSAIGLRPRFLAFILVAFAAAGAVDLITDEPGDGLHRAVEGAVVVAALAGAALLWRGWDRSRNAASELRVTLEQRSRERDAWESSARRALSGLAAFVQTEFDRWELTPAEREVALELLKGKSHKQIARATGRSERTARQHATSVYGKAGLDGRASLAGFFLDELILPGPPKGGAPEGTHATSDSAVHPGV
jgi:DNA-binding CsgD family transcriptional regulator